MRVFSVPSSPLAGQSSSNAPGNHPSVIFSAFSMDAFSRARARNVPVFLLIGDHPEDFQDPALCMQLSERTIAVHLHPGERPDVELLCQRAGELFSGEGALPLCALLTADALPFLAAPLPPSGFPLDAHRLCVWLSQADRRFIQNTPACTAQAAQVVHTFKAPPLNKP